MKKLVLSIITALVMLFGISKANAQAIDTLTTFYGANAGSGPQGSLVTDGTYLYSMTANGGTNSKGLIFKIKPDGTGYDTLLNFNGINGANPYGSLLLMGTTLYGMTNEGGPLAYGNIFKIQTDGTGFDTLINFNGLNGLNPSGSLISDGTYLYGMTGSGGPGAPSNGSGNIFKIKPDGTGFTDLYDFSSFDYPNGDLYYDGTYLYGMTQYGGANAVGDIFKIKPDGTGFTDLYDFNTQDYPTGSLISDGTYLYGMTPNGGPNNNGDIFKIKPDGSGFTAIDNFNNGENPKGSLIYDGTFLYGMTYGGGSGYGNIFKIKPDGSNYVDLADFNGNVNGAYPTFGSLLLVNNILYGATANQGPNYSGSIFGLYPQAAALNFDGVDDYIDAGTLYMSSYTKEAWVYSTDGTLSNNIISSNNAPFWLNSGNLSATNIFGSAPTLQDPNSFPVNAWTHVAVTYDSASTTMTLYKNGIQVAQSTSMPADPIVGEDILVGAFENANVFKGNMDEVRVWNYARTACQIKSSMNCELDSADKSNYNLLLYYQFNEGGANANNSSISIAEDSSFFGNGGTLTNFALTGTTSNWVSPGAVTTGVHCQPLIAVKNPAVILPGATVTLTVNGTATSYSWSTSATTATIAVTPSVTTTYTVTDTDANGCGAMAVVTVTVASHAAALDIEMGSNVVIGTSLTNALATKNSITVEAWVKPSHSNFGAIISNYSNPNGDMQFLLRQENDVFTFFADPGTGYKEVASPAATATVGVWQHVAGVWDGNNLLIYINGVLQATTTNVSGPNLNSTTTNSVIIGTDGGAEEYTGSLDEIRVWGRALCAAEIQNNMTAELKLPQTNLMAYYKFNQGLANDTNYSVTTLVDSSGNGFNGTLTNVALQGSSNNWVAPGAVTTGSMAPAFVSTVATQTNVTCNGNASGIANVAVTGAASPFTYTWSAGNSTTNSTTGLAAGNYTCTINYACGTTAQTFTITEPAQALIATSTSGTITCNGGATTVTVSATGGTTNYTGIGTFTATAGAQTYTVTDANLCAATTTITLTQPTQVTVTATAGTIACNGGTTTVTVSATGGTPTYSNTGTFTVTASVTQYNYIVTDANGCTGSANVTVSQPPAVNASVTVNNTILTANNATATSYQWVNCSTGNSSIAGATHQSFTPLANGSYAVIITEGSCTATSTCTTISTIGIAQYDATNNLQVYPNPFSNELTVVSSAKTSAMLFDMLGNQIKSFDLQSTTQTISLSDLAPGMYYLQVDNNKIKIIKQ